MYIVVQGRKQIIVADRTYTYDPSQYLAVSLELPAVGRVVNASPDEPYRAAQEIQLAIEYQPSPPYESGRPSTAPAAVREAVLQAAERSLDERRRIVERVTAKLVLRPSRPGGRGS